MPLMPMVPGGDFAVVVGINWYPGLNDLYGAENDARAFAGWLESSGGGNVPRGNLQLLVSSDFPKPTKPQDASPVASHIDAAFDRLMAAAEDVDGYLGRRLYMFFAGHGFAPKYEDTSLITADVRVSDASYHIPHIPARDYADLFLRAALFEEVVLLMDCCRDDFPNAPRREPPWVLKGSAGRRTRYAFGFATKWSFKAREKYLEEYSDVRGLFTTALLKGLQGNAADERGAVTTAALRDFVQNYLPTLSPDEYAEPVFSYDPRDDVTFAIQPDDTDTANLVVDAPRYPGIEVLGPMGEPIDMWWSNGCWSQQVKPGLYTVRIEERDTFVEVLESGREYNVTP